jgi:hypothetical protein
VRRNSSRFHSSSRRLLSFSALAARARTQIGKPQRASEGCAIQPAKLVARSECRCRLKRHMHGIRARAAGGVKARRQQSAQGLSGGLAERTRESPISIRRGAQQIRVRVDGLLGVGALISGGCLSSRPRTGWRIAFLIIKGRLLCALDRPRFAPTRERDAVGWLGPGHEYRRVIISRRRRASPC